MNWYNYVIKCPRFSLTTFIRQYHKYATSAVTQKMTRTGIIVVEFLLGEAAKQDTTDIKNSVDIKNIFLICITFLFVIRNLPVILLQMKCIIEPISANINEIFENIVIKSFPPYVCFSPIPSSRKTGTNPDKE